MGDARTLVGEAEVDTALDLIEAFLKGRLQGSKASRVRNLLNELLMVRARGRRIETRARQGLLTVDETETERARREQAVLGLISEVERINGFQPPPINISFPEQLPREKLMGSESHLRSTGWLAEGLRLATAICRLTDGNTMGSGFRCGGNAIITNHHVINSAKVAATFRAEFFFEDDAKGALKVPIPFALEPTRLFWTSEHFDITLVGLASVTRDDIAALSLSQNGSAHIGDHVSIIQHPSGGPKQIAVTNNRIVNFYDRFVQYLTDTLPGSSGSPVFLDTWEILAVHHAGGNVRKNAHGDVVFANEGILVSALLANSAFCEAYYGITQ